MSYCARLAADLSQERQGTCADAHPHRQSFQSVKEVASKNAAESFIRKISYLYRMNINLGPENNQVLFNSPFCIHKEAPKHGMLHSLLNNLRKPEVQQIYGNIAPFWHRDKVPDKGFSKNDYIIWLEGNLTKTAESFVTYENSLMVTFWLKFIKDENEEAFNQEIRETQDSPNVYNIYLEKILYLAEIGLLYLYGKDADNLKAYIPHELLWQFLKDEPSRDMFGFTDYCRVATNLYGVAAASDIADLWNRDHGTHFTGADLGEHLEKCALSSKFFHFYNGGLTDYRIEYGDDIIEILEGQRGKPTYMPSREEIAQWSFSVLDLNAYTPEFEKLFKAVKQFKDAGTAMEITTYLLESCLRGQDPFSEIEFLRTDFGLEFKHVKEFEKVLKLLQDFNNNCRMWVNLGYTPHSLPRQGDRTENFPGIQNEIPFPESTPPFAENTPFKNSSPKVGRNDPCPCGSGLKYKKCCGKITN